MDRLYRFEISRWARKVEIYDDGCGGQDVAYMAIDEGEMLDMIDEMLNEMEKNE